VGLVRAQDPPQMGLVPGERAVQELAALRVSPGVRAFYDAQRALQLVRS
jgi:hypothetical protein